MATRGAIAHRDLPRQKSTETQHADRLELVHLADELSVATARRQRSAPRPDDGLSVILPFPTTHRRPSAPRRLFLPVMLAVAAMVVVFLARSLAVTAPVPTPAATAQPVATQPTSVAQMMGQAAGHRLQLGGGTVDEFICAAAYNADAQSVANGLPPASARSAAQAEYMSACMSAM